MQSIGGLENNYEVVPRTLLLGNYFLSYLRQNDPGLFDFLLKTANLYAVAEKLPGKVLIEKVNNLRSMKDGGRQFAHLLNFDFVNCLAYALLRATPENLKSSISNVDLSSESEVLLEFVRFHAAKLRGFGEVQLNTFIKVAVFEQPLDELNRIAGQQEEQRKDIYAIFSPLELKFDNKCLSNCSEFVDVSGFEENNIFMKDSIVDFHLALYAPSSIGRESLDDSAFMKVLSLKRMQTHYKALTNFVLNLSSFPELSSFLSAKSFSLESNHIDGCVIHYLKGTQSEFKPTMRQFAFSLAVAMSSCGDLNDTDIVPPTIEEYVRFIGRLKEVYDFTGLGLMNKKSKTIIDIKNNFRKGVNIEEDSTWQNIFQLLLKYLPADSEIKKLLFDKGRSLIGKLNDGSYIVLNALQSRLALDENRFRMLISFDENREKLKVEIFSVNQGDVVIPQSEVLINLDEGQVYQREHYARTLLKANLRPLFVRGFFKNWKNVDLDMLVNLAIEECLYILDRFCSHSSLTKDVFKHIIGHYPLGDAGGQRVLRGFSSSLNICPFLMADNKKRIADKDIIEFFASKICKNLVRTNKSFVLNGSEGDLNSVNLLSTLLMQSGSNFSNVIKLLIEDKEGRLDKLIDMTNIDSLKVTSGSIFILQYTQFIDENIPLRNIQSAVNFIQNKLDVDTLRAMFDLYKEEMEPIKQKLCSAVDVLIESEIERIKKGLVEFSEDGKRFYMSDFQTFQSFIGLRLQLFGNIDNGMYEAFASELINYSKVSRWGQHSRIGQEFETFLSERSNAVKSKPSEDSARHIVEQRLLKSGEQLIQIRDFLIQAKILKLILGISDEINPDDCDGFHDFIKNNSKNANVLLKKLIFSGLFSGVMNKLKFYIQRCSDKDAVCDVLIEIFSEVLKKTESVNNAMYRDAVLEFFTNIGFLSNEMRLRFFNDLEFDPVEKFYQPLYRMIRGRCPEFISYVDTFLVNVKLKHLMEARESEIINGVLKDASEGL